MLMTPEQIGLVQDSWVKVTPIAETAAELFYGRLFEIAPEVKPYFKGDMKEQGKKLMAMINTAVNALNNVEAVVPAIQELGKRHVDYGVKAEDYDSVGAALIWTLEQGLGDDFTPETKEAWATVYGLVATTMKDAAYS
jgi:hemoglobin-like flavoprotein